MDEKAVFSLLTSLMWPLTTLILVFSFRSVIKKLLSRLADSAVIKTIKFKVFGVEIQLTPEEAKFTFDELLKDIADTTNELSPEAVALFKEIRIRDGRSDVITLCPGFIRNHSGEHEQLRALRDRKLIRPLEHGNWQATKHPILTRYGEIVWGIRDKILIS